MIAPAVDPQALLVALVLAPATFSRNRFFSLYADPGARQVRRRAALLRSIVRQLAGAVERAAVAPAERGGVVLTYEVPALGLKRTAALDPLEIAVIRFAVTRGGAAPSGSGAPSVGAEAQGAALPAALHVAPEDTSRIEHVLARLFPGDGQDQPIDAAELIRPGRAHVGGQAANIPTAGEVRHGSEAGDEHVHFLQDCKEGDPVEGRARG